MNEKPCCSLQITQASSVSQIQMEVTAGQRGGMMDSPHSESSNAHRKFAKAQSRWRGLGVPRGQGLRGAGRGGVLFESFWILKEKKRKSTKTRESNVRESILP